MSSNEWFTFMVKQPKLFVPVEDLLPVLSYRCFEQVKLGTTVRGLPKPESKVTVQRAKTKEAPGELGSMGLPLLCGEEAAFLSGTKQLPQTAVGSLMGEVIPEDTWEIGSIFPKARTESPELAALPKKASDEPQPQWAETAEPQGMAQPERGAFWCFVTVC